MKQAARAFLTAEWRDVIMLNYEVDPALLAPLVPAGTELDEWQGKYFISLVGFRFLNTRVLGYPIPFHSDFEEVNLRFYVRRREGNDWKRGVVFIREIVPRWAVATVARLVYNERYVSRSMSHRSSLLKNGAREMQYAWTGSGGGGLLSMLATGEPALPDEGSEERFITEHSWGYSAQRDGACLEYRVDHPSWRVWSGERAHFEGGADLDLLYGANLTLALRQAPVSAFLAEGSSVIVHRGERLTTQQI